MRITIGIFAVLLPYALIGCGGGGGIARNITDSANVLLSSGRKVDVSPWPMFHHDARHTGTATEHQVLGFMSWSSATDAGKAAWSSPAISKDGSTLYVGCDDGKIYAFDAANGAKKVLFDTAKRGRETKPVRSSPAISSDGTTLFVGGLNGLVYAITIATGKALWEADTKDSVESSPAISEDTVYIANMAKKVYALDAKTGKEKWVFDKAEDWIVSSPAVSDDGKAVYVGSYDGKVYGIDAATGQALPNWPFATGGDVLSSPAISKDGKTIFVGSRDKRVYAIDTATAKSIPNWPWYGLGTYGGGVESSPALSPDGKTVYVGTMTNILGASGNQVYAIDVESAKTRWIFTAKGSVRSSPAVSEDGRIVYVGSYDKNLYAIEVATGKKRWHLTTGGEIHSSPAIGIKGAIYIGSDDGKVYGIRPQGP